MGNFDLALESTLRFEGGYSDHPNDPGGETWQGITRRDHPSWPGWSMVDEARKLGRLKALMTDPRMHGHVADLYRARYWNPLDLDRFDDDAVAAKLFDIAVNAGQRRAAIILQRAINYLTPSTQEVAEDGSIGTATVRAANVLRQELLLMALCCEQFVHYRTLVESQATKKFEVFAGGWLKRAMHGICRPSALNTWNR